MAFMPSNETEPMTEKERFVTLAQTGSLPRLSSHHNDGIPLNAC